MLATSLIGNLTHIPNPNIQSNSRNNELAKFSNGKEVSNMRNLAVFQKQRHQLDDTKYRFSIASVYGGLIKRTEQQINASRRTSKTSEHWLEAALTELADCLGEALDEGGHVPSENSIHKAKSLIEYISSFVNEQPDIYQFDEDSIAIDFRNPNLRSGILLLVDGDGSGALFTRNNESKGRLRVTDAESLLDESLISTFRKFGIS